MAVFIWLLCQVITSVETVISSVNIDTWSPYHLI